MSGDTPGELVALTDPQILCLTLYGEARGESVTGQIAVGCVIRNRVEMGRWGSTYAKVCLHPWQFSCWRPQGGQANYDLVQQAAHSMLKGKLPDDEALRQCAWVAHGIIGRWLKDIVKDATHYYAPDAMVPPGTVPKWAVNLSPVVTHGRHLFFSGVKV
jgi:N-acetylmuramoyl-L-alanine amidase